MASDQSKPRFIRKNGKIIPIGGKKKSGSSEPKKRKKPSKPSKIQRDTKRAKTLKTAGFSAGLTAGIFSGKSLISKAGRGAVGGLLGGLLGKEIGITAGSVVKRRKGDSQKKTGQRAIKRADRIRKMLNSNTGF